MRTALLLLLATAAILSLTLRSSHAQTPAPPSATAANTLQAGTSLVVVDIVVTDHDGHPVTGLTAGDFRLTENNAPQIPRSFEALDAAAGSPAPRLPPMPPGVFTDFQPTPRGPLNVLLIDALNTPLNDQIYLREQLRRYIRQAPAGTRIAIFGLNAGLTLLQGFTSDPEVLRQALDSKSTTRRSNALTDSTGTRNGSDQVADGLEATSSSQAQGRVIASAAENIAQFEAQVKARETQTRILDTISAFTVLGHFLASFPGRKNLLWFSGSFPVNLLPDPSLKSPFQIVENNSVPFHAMVNLLSQAQVAVYPIDARGLETSPTYDSARPGSGYVGITGGSFSKDLTAFGTSRADQHATMQTLAADTGGKAFFNTNALTDAVNSAVRAGSSYYSLAYSPTDRTQNGAFRTLHVELTGPAAGHGYTLSYRHGYYAAAPSTAGGGSRLATATATAPAIAPAIAPQSIPGNKPEPARAEVPYEATAMGHGAPTPSELLFKVRLLPGSRETEPAAAPGNHVNTARAWPPFRRYAADFLALPSQLQLSPQPNGHRTGHVEFVVYVFNPDGNLLVTAGKSLDLDLTPANYTALAHQGLRLHLEVSAPAGGEHFFRLAVHDLDSRKMGVVEVSSLAVEHLDPPPPDPASGSAPPPSGNAPPTGDSLRQTAPGPSSATPSATPSPATSPQ